MCSVEPELTSQRPPTSIFVDTKTDCWMFISICKVKIQKLKDQLESKHHLSLPTWIIKTPGLTWDLRDCSNFYSCHVFRPSRVVPSATHHVWDHSSGCSHGSGGSRGGGGVEPEPRSPPSHHIREIYTSDQLWWWGRHTRWRGVMHFFGLFLATQLPRLSVRSLQRVNSALLAGRKPSREPWTGRP